MAKIEGGRLVARVLKQEGVEHIFILTGGHILSITQGCEDEGIKVIDARHEQAAVLMAEGWARATGKPGVAAVTAGPGVTNAVTGLWNAQGNTAPIVVFGGRVGMRELGYGSNQDMDQLSLVQTITKWSEACLDTKRIADYTSMAFRHALGGRPGPAYLEFPIDVLNATVEESEVTLPQNYRATARPQGDPTLVKKAVDLLLGAERPWVIAGRGIWWSQAAKELQEFVELTKIPITDVEGNIPTDHPLYSMHSKVAANRADVILLIGGRTGPRSGLGRQWIQVDIEPTEIGFNRPIDIGITGDPKAVLRQMIEEARDRCQGREDSPWVKEVRDDMESRREQLEAMMNSDEVPVHPARVCKEIRDFIDRDATVVLDGGDSANFGNFCIPRYHPGHFMYGSTVPTGLLGAGQPFAIAAKLARPDKQVLIFSGDGAFGLNAMEFDTMVRHKLPIVCVISNDQAWGMIKNVQIDRGDSIGIGTELGFVRYDKVVEALGGYGEAVERPEDIRPALERAFASGLPACINVKCSCPGLTALYGI